MRAIVKNNVKGIAVVLSAAMILGTTAIPTSDAKVKKPKLSTTKVSVQVGATKKVTVKNAKKVTWTINKAGKKVVSLSKKSKKGATIKAKAVGKAKITVKMKYGKKTLKKTIAVTVTKKVADTTKATPTPTVTPSTVPSASPSAAPSASPTAEPIPTITPVPDTAPAVYKVDFAKDARFEDSYCAEQSVEATGATVTFGQFHGIFYALPNTEQMQKSNYKHAYIIYSSTGNDLAVTFLNKDAGENGLADPTETYGRQENELRVDAGSLAVSEEETTLHLTTEEGISTNGVQIFNWNAEAELSLKAILFSEKELSADEIAAVMK